MRTRFTELFGLEYPIMSAPMAMHSSGGLAAAVSNAGALGTFGGINAAGPDWLREQIRAMREKTERPFGVGFITHFLQRFPMLLDIALEEKVPVIEFSFIDPGPLVGKAKDGGARVICQVQSLKSAREAIAAGADVLVAQGNEAGGHTGSMNLLPLLTSLVEAYPDIPIVAAGGICDGRMLAAVLATGADGACLGTAFLATPECTDVSDEYKQAIIDGSGEDTVFTSVIDIIQAKAIGIPPWPDGIAERVRRDALIEKWLGREDELRANVDSAVEEFRSRAAKGEGPVLMGQGAGAIKSVRPAAEVVRSICDKAERVLRENAGR